MYKYSEIRQIHLEITERCNAACPMCMRNINGGPQNPHISGAELSLEDCKQIFLPEFIQQLESMSMCGNLGDPIVGKHTLEVYEYFREHNKNMWLGMNTNAGARTPEWWRDLAKVIGKKGTVIFSVDGLEDTNHIYRRGVQWHKVIENMQAFVEAGGRARWDFLVFAHNEHQVEAAKQLAQKIGVERFTAKKSSRFFSSYTAELNELHETVDRKGMPANALQMPENPDFQNSSFKKTEQLKEKYGTMQQYYDQAVIDCKVAKEKNLYVTAEGFVLPCCWTAGRMYNGKIPDYRQEQIWKLLDTVGLDRVNAIENGLEYVVDKSGIMQLIEKSWSRPSCRRGKLEVCSVKCGSEFDAFKTQFE